MCNCQKPMETSQRSRGPFLLRLLHELENDSGTTAPSLRLVQVWFHMILLCYYVGSASFVEDVLMRPPDFEPFQFWSVAVAYVQGKTDNYDVALYQRLAFYILTRASAKRWLDKLDGTRLPWPDAKACKPRAFKSRHLDALLHVHEHHLWTDVSMDAAKAFLAVLATLNEDTSTEAEWRPQVYNFMNCCLKVPLLGRPKAGFHDISLG